MNYSVDDTMNKIPLLTYYTESHRELYERFFLPSFSKHLTHSFTLISNIDSQVCASGVYRSQGWHLVAQRKLRCVYDFLLANKSEELVVFSDVDVLFFEDFREDLVQQLGDFDMAFQDDDTVACTGFFVCKNNDTVRAFIKQSIDWCFDCDQESVNRLLKKGVQITYTKLDSKYYSLWRSYEGKPWRRHRVLPICVDEMLVFHANYTVGIANKFFLLRYFSRQQTASQSGRLFYWVMQAMSAIFNRFITLCLRLKNRLDRMLSDVTPGSRNNGHYKLNCETLLDEARVRRKFEVINKRRDVIVQTPKMFRPPSHQYPTHHRGDNIELYYFKHFLKSYQGYEENDERPVYLPIFWTNYYVMHGLGNAHESIQNFIDNNLNSRPYYTVVQSANGIQEDIPENIAVFGAGGVGDIALPLLCDAHERDKDLARNCLASFIGRLDTETNERQIRLDMYGLLKDKQDVVIMHNAGTEEFVKYMQTSIFALCPRGFGKTSFRLYEAMQLGSIPVYIYDDPWLPFSDEIDWSEFCVLVPKNEINGMYERLRSYTPEQIAQMQRRIEELQVEYFNFHAVSEYIDRKIHKLSRV